MDLRARAGGGGPAREAANNRSAGGRACESAGWGSGGGAGRKARTSFCSSDMSSTVPFATSSHLLVPARTAMLRKEQRPEESSAVGFLEKSLATLDIPLLLFAGPRELLGGVDRIIIHVSSVPATICGLRSSLLAAYPSLAPLLPSCVFAVQEALVTTEEEASRALQPSEEVALIPPVSGG